MKITNILLSILILLLAAASAVFSYFLFEKRSQFVSGWGKMALAINEAAAELDKDSGTKPLASELSVQALSHEQYATLDQKLPKLKDRSRQIVNTRNSLADAVRRIGSMVGTPNLASEKSLRGIDTYEAGKNSVVNSVRDTVAKRDRMYSYVDQLSRRFFRKPVSRAKMLQADRTALADLEKGIRDINNRRSAYENALRNIGRMVEVRSFDASDRGFSRSSTNVTQGVRNLQNRCNTAQRNLDAANRRIKAHERTIAARNNTINSLRRTIADKNSQISSYKRALGRPVDDSTITPWKDGSNEALRRLVGKVIEVHEKYGYIALDVGKGSTVIQEIGNRKLEVNAGVKKGLDFIVARGSLNDKSNFIARVVIDEVGEFCSTANVSPGSQKIKVGDFVYWSNGK